mgnify:FL=1
MEAKTNSSSRLRLKDIITLSIFNIAMLVIMVIVKMIMTIAATPAFDYLFYVGVMAFFCAPLYIVMSNKTAKRGTLFITSLFCGLMMAAFGSVWFLAVILVAGLICELLMLGDNSYKNPVRNGIGYAAYWMLYAWGSSIPLFFFKEWYLKSLGDSYTEEGKQVLIRFYGSLDMMLLIGLISAALAAAGFWVGMLFFKKHIKKAKLA